MSRTRPEDKKNEPASRASEKPASRSQTKLSNKTNVSHKLKKRNWTIVVYPESLPENWKDILRESGLQVAISPLHDKDKNPDGTVKKAHYHLILIYSGPTSYNVVLALTQKLKAPIPKALEAVRGMYRYFTHKDNPEKYQYDEKEIECLNGFDILDFVELTKSEVLKIKKSLQLLIRQLNLHEYSDFMDYCLENLTDSEYDVASSHTFFFDKYLTSRRHSFGSTKTIDTSDLAETALNLNDGAVEDIVEKVLNEE